MKTEFKVLIIVAIILLLVIVGTLNYSILYGKVQDLLYGPVLVRPDPDADVNILFLHHSTGNNVWNGGIPEWFEDHNDKNGTKYSIKEQDFPKRSPYGWNNYPYDYWNIWIKHAGKDPYIREPTLEMIVEKFDVVVFKHCFPVANILPDEVAPDVASSERTLANYKVQYEALREKMKSFPDTKFIVWTGPALLKNRTDEGSAERMSQFVRWVKEEWDQDGDNIRVWDFYCLETEGSIYMKQEHAVSSTDPHPNEAFCRVVAPDLCREIVRSITE